MVLYWTRPRRDALVFDVLESSAAVQLCFGRFSGE